MAANAARAQRHASPVPARASARFSTMHASRGERPAQEGEPMRQWMRKTWRAAAAAALCLGAAAAHGQTLRVGVREAPGPLDPMRAGTLSARMVLASLCERLVDIDPHLRIVPGVAQ